MKVKVLWIVTQGSGARPCSNAPWSCGCLSSLQRPCPHSKSFGGGSCRQVKHLNLSQHFFGTLIHQLTQTNNLLVTVNRCQEESVCLTIHSVLPTHPASSVNFIIYCIFGEKFRRVLLQRVASCQGFHNRTHSTLRQELHNLEVFHQRQREEEWWDMFAGGGVDRAAIVDARTRPATEHSRVQASQPQDTQDMLRP